MLGDSQSLNRFFLSFFVELLEFSEDRHPWESVEEKLDAIRYELLASIIYPLICPSFPPIFVPSPLLLSLRLSMSTPLSVFTSLPAPVLIPPSFPSVPRLLPRNRRLFLCPIHFAVSGSLHPSVPRFPRRFLSHRP